MPSIMVKLAGATVFAGLVCIASPTFAGAAKAKRADLGTGAAVVTAASGTGIVGGSGRIASPVSVTTATGAVVTGVPVVLCDSPDRCQATGLGSAVAGTLIVPGTALVAGRAGALEREGAAAVSGTPAATPAGRFTSVAVMSPTGEVVYGAPMLDCGMQGDCRPVAASSMPKADVADVGSPPSSIAQIATVPDMPVGPGG